MTALAVLLAGSSAAGEPSAAGVQLVVGDNACPAALIYRNLVLTSSECLDGLAPQGAALDHVAVSTGASLGRARKELERGRPYVADYALVVVRWETAPPPPVSMRLGAVRAGERVTSAGVVALDEAGRMVGMVSPDGDVIPTALIVAESPRLSRFVVAEGARSEPPFLFPDDGDWF